LMSDGVTRLVSPFEQTSWHGLLAAVLNSGPASVIKHVRSIEAADAQGERWPRFKVSDDATIAVISALTDVDSHSAAHPNLGFLADSMPSTIVPSSAQAHNHTPGRQRRGLQVPDKPGRLRFPS
jgi:hypothetical protein